MIDSEALNPLRCALMGAVDVLRQNVKRLMARERIRPADLKRAMGVSAGAVTNFLQGTQGFKVDRLDALARALNTTVPDLFTDRDLLASGHPLGSASGAAHDPQAIIDAYEVVSKRLIALAVATPHPPTAPTAPKPGRARRARKSR